MLGLIIWIALGCLIGYSAGVLLDKYYTKYTMRKMIRAEYIWGFILGALYFGALPSPSKEGKDYSVKTIMEDTLSKAGWDSIMFNRSSANLKFWQDLRPVPKPMDAHLIGVHSTSWLYETYNITVQSDRHDEIRIPQLVCPACEVIMAPMECGETRFCKQCKSRLTTDCSGTQAYLYVED